LAEDRGDAHLRAPRVTRRSTTPAARTAPTTISATTPPMSASTSIWPSVKRGVMT
jgi:hypothetical protein